MGPNLPADGNNDGEIDAADYDISHHQTLANRPARVPLLAGHCRRVVQQCSVCPRAGIDRTLDVRPALALSSTSVVTTRSVMTLEFFRRSVKNKPGPCWLGATDRACAG